MDTKTPITGLLPELTGLTVVDNEARINFREKSKKEKVPVNDEQEVSKALLASKLIDLKTHLSGYQSGDLLKTLEGYQGEILSAEPSIKGEMLRNGRLGKETGVFLTIRVDDEEQKGVGYNFVVFYRGGEDLLKLLEIIRVEKKKVKIYDFEGRGNERGGHKLLDGEKNEVKRLLSTMHFSAVTEMNYQVSYDSDDFHHDDSYIFDPRNNKLLGVVKRYSYTGEVLNFGEGFYWRQEISPDGQIIHTITENQVSDNDFSEVWVLDDGTSIHHTKNIEMFNPDTERTEKRPDAWFKNNEQVYTDYEIADLEKKILNIRLKYKFS